MEHNNFLPEEELQLVIIEKTENEIDDQIDMVGIMEQYRILNDKCDVLLRKIESRKSQNN